MGVVTHLVPFGHAQRRRARSDHGDVPDTKGFLDFLFEFLHHAARPHQPARVDDFSEQVHFLLSVAIGPVERCHFGLGTAVDGQFTHGVILPI